MSDRFKTIRANTGHAVLQSTQEPPKMRVHYGTMERRMGGRTDGSMHGWMDGRKDIWMDGTERLIGASQHLVRDWNSFALDKALNLIIHFFRF